MEKIVKQGGIKMLDPLFLKCADFVFEREGNGKVTNIPGDKGGLTKWGIAEKYNPQLTRVQIMNLTKDQALQIYHKKYWEPSKSGKMAWPLTLINFDSAILCGPERTAKFLQEALKVKIDGIIGIQTMQALEKVNPKITALRVLAIRKKYHESRSEEQKNKFLKGWLNRIKLLEKEIEGSNK